MSELLPCPFCKADPVMRHYMDLDDRPELAMWIHPDTGCYMDGEIVSIADNADEIAKWNTRASPWQPIETAPKDGRNVMLSDGHEVTEGGWLSQVAQGAEYEGQGGVTACWWNVAMIESPTHWMPLPEPPQ